MWICNLFKNVVFQTVISGAFVFIVGQLFMEYILKPLRRYEELRGEAAYFLTFYGNRYNTKDEISKKANTMEEARKLAAKLRAFSIEMPKLFFKRKRRQLDAASVYFIGLSNNVNDNPNFNAIHDNEDKIMKALKLNSKIPKRWRNET